MRRARRPQVRVWVAGLRASRTIQGDAVRQAGLPGLTSAMWTPVGRDAREAKRGSLDTGWRHPRVRVPCCVVASRRAGRGCARTEWCASPPRLGRRYVVCQPRSKDRDEARTDDARTRLGWRYSDEGFCSRDEDRCGKHRAAGWVSVQETRTGQVRQVPPGPWPACRQTIVLAPGEAAEKRRHAPPGKLATRQRHPRYRMAASSSAASAVPSAMPAHKAPSGIRLFRTRRVSRVRPALHTGGTQTRPRNPHSAVAQPLHSEERRVAAKRESLAVTH
jgi:hypothetical protein